MNSPVDRFRIENFVDLGHINSHVISNILYVKHFREFSMTNLTNFTTSRIDLIIFRRYIYGY